MKTNIIIIIIDLLGLAARSWINTMHSNKSTLGLMSNVSNSVRLHIVHNPDIGYYSKKCANHKDSDIKKTLRQLGVL